MPATLDDVARYALALPGTVEGVGKRSGGREWLVGGKVLAWERALSKADVKRLGDEPVPEGPLLAVRSLDLEDRDAVLAEGHKGFFSIAHFAGYPAFLIQLRLVGKRDLRMAITDAWMATAPPALHLDLEKG